MATLTRYNNFKSLKCSTNPKVKKVGNASVQQLQEIEIFLNLLKNKKTKANNTETGGKKFN